MLANALQELEERVRTEVEKSLAAADTTEGRQLDLARHTEDYRTWRRMGEAPAHVVTLADRIGPSLAPDMAREQLLAELVAMLERIYDELDSGDHTRPPVDDNSGQTAPHQ